MFVLLSSFRLGVHEAVESQPIEFSRKGFRFLPTCVDY